MTSVSQSEHDDEAPEGTGRGIAESRGRIFGARAGAGRARRGEEGSKRTAASQDASARARDERAEAARAALAQRGGRGAEGGAGTGVRAAAAVRLAERRALAIAAAQAQEPAGSVDPDAAGVVASLPTASGEFVVTTLEPAAPPRSVFAAVPDARESHSLEDAAVFAPLVAVPPAVEPDPEPSVDAEPAAEAIVEPLLEPVVDPVVDDDVEPAPESPSADPAPAVETAVVVETAPAAEPPAPIAPLVPERVAEPVAAEGLASEPAAGPAVVGLPRERRRRLVRAARPAPGPAAPEVLEVQGLVKRFGDVIAVDALDLVVRAGSFTGIVGPNGAGKTTTLSMISGLLRPDAGSIRINGHDAWKDARAVKRITGVLPDHLRTFDRLTGMQLLYSTGVLRGLDRKTARSRADDLTAAFGLDEAIDRLVSDYSAGLTKKVALAAAMIHSPRLLVLDEPFEGVDPVSSATMTDVLVRYAAAGGTVLLSSHSMDLIERVCDSAVVIIGGRVLASGTLDEVRDGVPLEERFVELAGGAQAAEGMEWLHSFSD